MVADFNQSTANVFGSMFSLKLGAININALSFLVNSPEGVFTRIPKVVIHDVDRQVSCLRVTDAQPLVPYPYAYDNLI